MPSLANLTYEKIYWTHKAQTDLTTIVLFIKQDKPEAAKKFVSEIRKKVLSLKNQPRIGRIVPEIRELIHKNYRIVYLVKKNSIDILTVFEGHKLLNLSY